LNQALSGRHSQQGTGALEAHEIGVRIGPVIGEYVAGRVSGDPGDPELRKIFALAGRSDAEANSAPR